ncbi:hypothetical protein CYQ88_00820 [Hydrogenovibrio sp. SC-1]|uniref:O-antigen translocase n=1 Tax=Hydrogenovibrio sp. SC-1 TaxID=2065820 RepID=UPI000C7AC3F5|nr:O-antigen translocase [Hydrogenovibrio sp. SC-1]PLA75541.1 hypothetical protein CYQ88_00820 [Hydrogenovibrio sp. SC-1]
MNINTIFVLTTFQTVVKLLSGILINKVFAVYLGPAGLAVVGQLQNFISLVINVASGSIHTGLVKYTAEYSDDHEKRRKIWGNGFYLSLILSGLVIVFISLNAEFFSELILFSQEYTSLIAMLALTMVFQVIYMFILSILNGLQDLKVFIITNIVISVLTTVITVWMSIDFGLDGALYSIIICQFVVFIFVSLIFYSRYGVRFFYFGRFKQVFEKDTVKKLLQFGMVSFISGVVLSLTQIGVRNIVVNSANLDVAGYWEALMKISTYFTMLFLLPASIYYLPRFAELKSVSKIKSLFLKSVVFFLPFALFGAFVFWLFKEFFIELLLSKEFLVIAPLVVLMLIGDIFRILAYLIVNLMFAKKFLFRLILLDIVYGSVFITLVYFLFADNGMVLLGYVYLFCNVLIFLYTIQFYLNIDTLLEKKGA